jgi:TfoX/Sxy family transcriptional regulator of competence genes
VAYDTELAERIRHHLEATAGITEQKMFGGIGFMLRGNMCCGVMKDSLLVRVGPEVHDDAVAQAHAEPMSMGGRVSRGFVVVAPPAIESDAALAAWIEKGLAFAGSLPAK